MSLARRLHIHLLILLLLTFPVLHPLFALDDFIRDVEEGQSENESEEEESADNGDSDDRGEDESDDEDRGFGGFLLDLTVLAWSLHNRRVHYSPYPYSIDGPTPGLSGGNFVHNSRLTGGTRPFSVPRDERKRYWMEISAGGLAGDSPALGGLLSVQGRFFSMFGPDITLRHIYDGSSTLTFTTGGIDLALFQFNTLGASLYAQAASFRGALDLDGAAGGLKLHSYPVKPVSLNLRVGAVSLSGSDLLQVEGYGAWHIGRFALFAGANMLQADTERLITLESGVTLHF